MPEIQLASDSDRPITLETTPGIPFPAPLAKALQHAQRMRNLKFFGIGTVLGLSAICIGVGVSSAACSPSETKQVSPASAPAPTSPPCTGE